VHSARQDLEIFAHLLQTVPAPIFDTQIAAAFCGYPDQIGYAALAAELCGVTVDKTHTRADWTLRPLAPALFEYACADVRYLPAMARALAARLAVNGRQGWVDEECARLTDPALYAGDPQDAWRRVKGANAVPGAGRALLRELAAWRETVARASDRPRGWILPDPCLLAIATTRPRDLAALADVPGLAPGTVRRFGPDLLRLVAEAPPPGAADPESGQVAAPVARDTVSRWLEWLRVRCAAAELAAHLVATRQDLERALGGQRDLPLFRGWRRAFIGSELERLLAAAPGAPPDR
jgi:ribonuclease D